MNRCYQLVMVWGYFIEGVAFRDILGLAFFSSLLFLLYFPNKLCLFLSTKLHKFSRITFDYVNYLPFYDSFFVFFYQMMEKFPYLWRARFDLGKHDVLQPLVDEEQLCPSEYYNPVQSNTAKHQRQRAVGRLNTTNKEEPP